MRILTLAFSGCAFSHWHSQDAHSHAAILTIRILTLPFSQCTFSLYNVVYKIIVSRILTLPFSGCAFSHWHSQDAHSHTAILRMRILTLPFSGCAVSHIQSESVLYVSDKNISLNKFFTRFQYFAMSSRYRSQ